MVHRVWYRIAAGALLVILHTGSVGAEPIEPNIVGLDLAFVYSSVSYDSSTGKLSGAASAAVATFEPVLGGTRHPVFNLTGGVGASFTLLADFDHVGTEFDVDGFFTSTSLPADIGLTGTIPSLGITPAKGSSGILLSGEIIDLQMYGDTGAGAFALNGYFRATGGDLITAGYLEVNDTCAMRSWLSSVSPSLAEGFDFTTDFTAMTHEGGLGAIPEPATAVLLAVGAGLLALRRRHSR